MAAININHNEGTITIDGDRVLQITDNGAIRIGNANYMQEINSSELTEILRDYEGALRYNEITKTLQYCDGMSWKDFGDVKDGSTGIIWSITF